MTDTKPVVVVGVDGSADSSCALRWAAHYAEQAGANLLLVTAWQWPRSYGAPVMWPAYQPDEEARSVVEQARASVHLNGGTVDVAVREGRPGMVLVDLTTHAAALVVGSQGHGVVAEAVLGSVSAYCVRHAHCPVVVVR